MPGQSKQSETALVAELNDLLQLDHDAVQAYSLALSRLQSESHKEAVRGFRQDHERHIEELTRLVRVHGGVPVQLPHLPTSAFKLAVQGVGALGGDAAVVLTFKANERQSRDKYQRASEREHAPDVATFLRGAAADEQRHYSWAAATAEALGVGAETTAGRVEGAVEVGHARMADAMEAGERQAMAATEGARRGLARRARERPMQTVLLALGTGFVAARLMGRDR